MFQPSKLGLFGGSLSLAMALSHPSQSQTAADENFQARCTGPGVVKCLNFDSNSGMTMMGGAKLDTEMKASGASSMRVDIAPTAGDAPGNITTKLGADFGEGSSLYLQWRQRFSPEMVDTDLGGEGFKQVVIYDAQPGGNVEVAMLNLHYSGYPSFYTAMGASYFEKKLSNGDITRQWSGDSVICTEKDKSQCLNYLPDEWMTFYYEQKIGTWGQPNSTVKVWMAGEDEPLTQFIDIDDYTFKSENANSAYRTIWIGPYSLGRKANSSYPTARTWIDEFIISKQPIADPYEAATALRDPHPETMPAAGKNDVRADVSGTRVSFTFAEGEAYRLRVFDRRGKLVHAFAEPVSGSAAWDASHAAKGIYWVVMESEKQRMTRTVSLLQ